MVDLPAGRGRTESPDQNRNQDQGTRTVPHPLLALGYEESVLHGALVGEQRASFASMDHQLLPVGGTGPEPELVRTRPTHQIKYKSNEYLMLCQISLVVP